MHVLLLLFSSTGQSLCKWWNLRLPRHLENTPTKSSSNSVRERQLPGVSRLDLVWDSCKDDALKTASSVKRGKEVRMHMVSSAVIPGNWQSFQRVDPNKDELFHIPVCCAGAVLPKRVKRAGNHWWWSGRLPSKTKRRKSVTPFRRRGHSHHAACGICCWTWPSSDSSSSVDTDVVVLVVMVTQALPCVDEYLIGYGMCKNYIRHIPANEIAASLGYRKHLHSLFPNLWPDVTRYQHLGDMGRNLPVQHGTRFQSWLIPLWRWPSHQSVFRIT